MLLISLPNKSFMRLLFASLLFFGILCRETRAEDVKSASVAQIIQWLLADPERLEAIPFPEIILAVSGKKVIPIEATDAIDQEIVSHVQAGAARVMRDLNAEKSPVKGLRRINEASKFFEDLLVKELTNEKFACQFPKTAEGSVQRSGYPDLELVHKKSGRISYIDPKLFEATSRTSTLRTFYFEPKGKTNKVTKDAHHLLLGFAHDGKDGQWSFVSFDLVDISKLKVRLKAEFDASNKEVYQPRNIVPLNDPPRK